MSISSPCVKHCEVSNGVCAGCKRTLAEIAGWRTYTDTQKQQVLDRIWLDAFWPNLSFPPVNLLTVIPARWR